MHPSACDTQLWGDRPPAACALAPTPVAPPVVGRDEELRIIDQALDGLARSGGAIAIQGVAGIGKSTLVGAARNRASARGYLVLTAAGVASERSWPFAGLHQLLAPLREECERLPRPQRLAIVAAFGGAGDVPAQPFLVGLAALGVLTAVAMRRPVVLVVDDIHWLDAHTQDVLAFLCRRVSRVPVLIVGGVRGAHCDFTAACGTRIELAELAEAPARALLEQCAVDLGATEVEGIVELARGNPLALVELPAVWPRPSAGMAPVALSARLERAFAVGLEQLPANAKDVVLVAAVSDEESSAEILAAARVLSGTELSLDALSAAVDAGVLRFADGRLEFSHPLIRSGILQDESTRRRQAAHCALAEVVGDDPFRHAWHRAQATIGFDDEIADALEHAHRAVIQRGRAGAAIAALERAAQLTREPARRGRRLLLAAEHAFGLGRADTVARLRRAAGQYALSEHDVARSGWLREIFTDGVPGDVTGVTELCTTARRAAEVADTDLALNLLLGAALRCWWADAGQLTPRLVSAEASRLGQEDDPRHVAAIALAEPIRQGRRVHRVLSQLNAESITDGDTLRLLGLAAHAAGDPIRAIGFFDRAEVRLREQARIGLLAHVVTLSLSDRIEIGDWDRIAIAGAEAERLTHQSDQPVWNACAVALNALAAGLRGDVERAQFLAARAEVFASERGLGYLLARVQLARGHALMSDGRYGEAYSALRRLYDAADPCHHRVEKLRGLTALAEAAVHADRVLDAQLVLAELEALAATAGSPVAAHHLAYARAVLAGEDDAERLFHGAFSADLARWPLARARLELAYGSWLRRRRRSAQSREPLRAALATFTAIGAPSWAEAAGRELRAAGGSGPAAAGPDARDVLSAQELQIARLVAEGLSNKQVGERLYLSPRTIGSHLYRIFPKLDITSRGQLAGRLRSG